jgi:hypothetical protein
MKISKYDLCDACLAINPIMDNGMPYEKSIADFFDSPGYNNGTDAFVMINFMVLEHLKNNGGCTSCINALKRVTIAA